MAIRVLVVDDLEFMRDVIRDILEEAGIEVAGEAGDGKSGIRSYAAIRPDVVLMDITMPIMDGLRALKMLRSIDPRAIVVMCSSLGQQEYIIRAVQLGARDFIVKPFKPERVVSAVQKAARARE